MDELFQNSAIQLKTISDLRLDLVLALHANHTEPDAVTRVCLDQVTRHVSTFGKLFRRLQQNSVARFVALPMCSELVLYYWDKIVQATNGPPEFIAGVFPTVPCVSNGNDH